MPRAHRIIVENGHYHVYNRANNHRSINLIDQSFDIFISLLKQIKEQFKLDIYAYCLMTNHYHIQLKTNKANIDKAMNYFGIHYARYINKITNSSGPVFTGRYQARFISDESYLLQVLRYIHLNPEEAGLCEHFARHRWSSMQDYINADSTIVNIDEMLNRFISFDDFINFHEKGNSKLLQHFYKRKHVPSIIDDSTIVTYNLDTSRA